MNAHTRLADARGESAQLQFLVFGVIASLGLARLLIQGGHVTFIACVRGHFVNIALLRILAEQKGRRANISK